MPEISVTPLQPDDSGTKVLLDYDLNTSELISFLVEYEARKLGLQTQRLSPVIAIFRDDKAETIMQRACARGISRIAYEVTKDKSLTKLLFDQAGIAHSPYVKLRPFQLDQALEFARGCNFDVV